jgi:hypothetical protein
MRSCKEKKKKFLLTPTAPGKTLSTTPCLRSASSSEKEAKLVANKLRNSTQKAHLMRREKTTGFM